MADQDDGERGEQPARSYGVHWPSNPNAPVTAEEQGRASEPKAEPEVEQRDIATPVAPSVEPLAFPPPPPIPPVVPSPPPVSFASNDPVVTPESSIPVVDAIPVPPSTPGLPVDPLFGDFVPTPATSSGPASGAEPTMSETSGMSRRELRRLREQAAERIGDSDEPRNQSDVAVAPPGLSAVSSPLAPASPSAPPVTPRVASPYENPLAQPAELPAFAVQSPQVNPVPMSNVPTGDGSEPLSTTLPGVPAVAAELAAITGRLDIIEAGQGGVPIVPAPSVPLVPSVIPEPAVPVVDPLGGGLDARLPSVSTTGGVPTSGHSLVVTNIPTDVPSALSAMNETGEIIVTGQIILPSSVAQTGTDSRRLDTSEIDVIHEQEAQVTTNTGRLAPVSATRAVSAFSTTTSAGTVVRGSSHRMSTALIIVGAAIGVIALGAFVTYLLMNILGK